jgi:hypothetical protein
VAKRGRRSTLMRKPNKPETADIPPTSPPPLVFANILIWILENTTK